MRTLLFLFSLAVLTSCNKDKTTPATNNSGTYSFEYTFKGQKYTWSGAMPVSSNIGAYATISTDLKIVLNRDIPTGSNYYPIMSFSIPNTGIGQFEVNPTSAKITPQNPNPTVCGVTLGIPNPSSDTYSSGLGSSKVNISITEFQQGRGGHVKGSFSGTIYNLNGSAETISGSFDAYRIN